MPSRASTRRCSTPNTSAASGCWRRPWAWGLQWPACRASPGQSPPTQAPRRPRRRRLRRSRRRPRKARRRLRPRNPQPLPPARKLLPLRGPQTSATSGTSATASETSTKLSPPGSFSPPAVVRSSGGARTSTTRLAGEAASVEPTAAAQPSPSHALAIPAPKTAAPHGSETSAVPAQLPRRSATPAPRSGTSAATARPIAQQRPDGPSRRPPPPSLRRRPPRRSPPPRARRSAPRAPRLAAPTPARANVATDLLGKLGLVPLGTPPARLSRWSPRPRGRCWTLRAAKNTGSPTTGTIDAASRASNSLVEGAAETSAAP